MNSSYKGNSISMGILLPFFVTMHSDAARVGSYTGAVRSESQTGKRGAERGIGGMPTRGRSHEYPMRRDP